MTRSMLCTALAVLALACAHEASDFVAVRVRTNGAPVHVPEGWTKTVDADGSLVLRPPKDDELAAFEEREKLASVQGITASIIYTLRDTACPGTFAKAAKDDHQWHLKHINAFDAWKLTPPAEGKQLGEGAVVCHIDTGYTDHPVLKDALDSRRVMFFGGFSEAKPLLDARDPLTGLFGGHGTETAALIAGIEGVAPKARLLPIRVTDSVILSHDTEKSVARGIRYAIRSGCRVISMSLGTPWTFPGEDDMRNAVFEAAASGVILVVAAGNCFGNVVQPASYQGALAVAATDVFDQPWLRTSDGPSVVISAPGDTLWAAKTLWDSEGGYDHDYGAGTSYSTALVAGSAALWLGFHGAEIQRAYPDPSDVPRAFRWLLHNRAFRPVRWKQLPNRAPWQMGSGILDVKKLLEAKLPDANDLKSEPSLDKEDRLAFARRSLHDLEARGELPLKLSPQGREGLEKDPVALEELLFLAQQQKAAQASGATAAPSAADALAASAGGEQKLIAPPAPAPAPARDGSEIRQLCDKSARLKRYLEQ